MDGIVKTRCLFEHDMSFSPKKEDYDMLKTIWMELIKSWIKGDAIKELPLNNRVDYLPENSQFIYEVICKNGHINRYDLLDEALKDMSKPQFNEAYIILLDNGLIKEQEGEIKPYYKK